MATRTKAQAEKLLQDQLEQERELRLEAERVAREQLDENRRMELDTGNFEYAQEGPDNYARARAYCALMGPDEKLAVYRRGLQRKESFVGTIEASNFDPDVVKERFGGGDYIFKGYNEKHQIDFRAEISIEGKPKLEAEGPATIDHQTQKPQLDMQQIVAMMAESNRAMIADLGRMLASTTKTEKSTADVLNEIKAYKEIFGPSTPVAVVQPVDQLMSAMKMGAELAGMNGGGDSNQAWLLKAMDTFGKPIMDAIASGQLAAPREPARIPAPQQRIATPQQTTEDDPMNLMIKGYIGILTKAARMNEGVEEYADSILNLIPENDFQQFEIMIRADDWQERMALYAPAVNDYPGWFLNLRNTIIEFMDADNADKHMGSDLTVIQPGGSVQPHETIDPNKTKDAGDTGGNA